LEIFCKENEYKCESMGYFCPVIAVFWAKKSSPRCWDRFYNIITEHKFIQLFCLF
jgi:hypothetical protein